jgi:hypothetical protein
MAQKEKKKRKKKDRGGREGGRNEGRKGGRSNRYGQKWIAELQTQRLRENSPLDSGSKHLSVNPSSAMWQAHNLGQMTQPGHFHIYEKEGANASPAVKGC